MREVTALEALHGTTRGRRERASKKKEKKRKLLIA